MKEKGVYDKVPEPSTTERELYAVFDLLEEKLKTLPRVRWQALKVTRAGDGFEVRVTV